MQKITSIHLNRKAYNLEEEAYVLLRGYLERAELQLKDNPDRTEIMADHDQAIGEKCWTYLNPNKDVVTMAEIDQVIKDMGPVNGTGSGSAEQKTDNDSASTAPKRLYLIREGAMIAGVCTGLAAYFNIDVTLVRLAFAMLTIVTGGVWISLYVILAIIVPYASTSEERAAARGKPVTAQDIINRAKETYARMRNKK